LIRKALGGGAILFFLLTFIFFPSAAGAGDPGLPAVRVLLDKGLSRVGFEAVQGGYRLVDAQGKEFARPGPGETWEVRLEEGQLKLYKEGQPLPPIRAGMVEFRPADDKALNVFRYQGKRYRGSLRVLYDEGSLAAVNTLDLEEYLYGVVGAEMGTDAGQEALKAQAVVSRTYALSRIRPEAPYDVTDDTSTQLYQGYEAELVPGAAKVKEAVDATRGQVIFYEGKLIEAYFHSNAGGHTEDSENVWSAALPYLRGVPSPEDEYALQYGGWPADTYRWTLILTREEVQRRVEAWLQRTGQKTDIGPVRDLIVTRQRADGTGPTVSGRATRLDIVGERGEVSAFRNAIRSVLGLRSTLFTLEADSTVAVVDGRGNRRQVNYGGELVAVGAVAGPVAVNGAAEEYVVAGRDGSRTVPKVFRQVIIQGRGNGHGVGLSQWGARGMAAKGDSYREIIEHYYNQGRRDGKLVIAPFTGR